MEQATTLGTAVWADDADIGARYSYNPETDFFVGRNPYNYDQAIGVNDDRHVFLCAGSRGGKGRSIVIPNLLNWRGSIVADDPKGENASICAARRANGDSYCEGLGQETYVLDPYGIAHVPDELRASCNLMDALDADSGSLLSQCEVLAEAMRVNESGGESESWSKSGAKITALVIAHVKTYDGFEDKDRNLVTVRELITLGSYGIVEHVKRLNKEEITAADREGREPKLQPVPDPYEMLFHDMMDNKAQRGAIARRAHRRLNLMRTNVRQFGSLIENADQETAFIDDLEIEDQLIGSSAGGRAFKISDLQDDPNGISVFITLPDEPEHPAVRWKKALIALILGHMAKNQRMPATGKRVLMVLDEFASNGRMDKIANGMNSIAGAGVKLFIIVTQIADLENEYQKAWTKLLAGCGLQMWFEINDYETGSYIEKAFGETQVVLNQRSVSRAKTTGTGTTESTTEGEGWSETQSEGHSKGTTHSTAKGHTKGHNQSISESINENWSDTRGSSTSSSRGRQSGWSINRNTNSSRSWGNSSSYGVGSTNHGRNSSSSDGSSHGSSRSGGYNQSNTIGYNRSKSRGGGRGRSNTHGTSESTSETETFGESSTLSQTYARGTSGNRSTTRGTSTNESETFTASLSENIQKRPLITIAEQNRWLSRVEVRDDPNYPGFALVRIAGEDPLLARKCYYDQDRLFEGCFTPHYAYLKNFLPKSQQRLVGGEYTPAHFVPVRLPDALRETAARIDVDITKLTDEWFEKDDELFIWEGTQLKDNAKKLQKARTEPLAYRKQDNNTPAPFEEPKVKIKDRVGEPVRSSASVPAPYTGKVIDVALDTAFKEDGDIMLLRLEREFTDAERKRFEWKIFHQLIEYLRVRGATQADIDRMLAELNERYRSDWQEHQDKLAAERERQERLAQQKRDKAERERREREAEIARQRHEKNIRIARAAAIGFASSIVAAILITLTPLRIYSASAWSSAWTSVNDARYARAIELIKEEYKAPIQEKSNAAYTLRRFYLLEGRKLLQVLPRPAGFYRESDIPNIVAVIKYATRNPRFDGLQAEIKRFLENDPPPPPEDGSIAPTPVTNWEVNAIKHSEYYKSVKNKNTFPTLSEIYRGLPNALSNIDLKNNNGNRQSHDIIDNCFRWRHNVYKEHRPSGDRLRNEGFACVIFEDIMGGADFHPSIITDKHREFPISYYMAAWQYYIGFNIDAERVKEIFGEALSVIYHLDLYDKANDSLNSLNDEMDSKIAEMSKSRFLQMYTEEQLEEMFWDIQLDDFVTEPFFDSVIETYLHYILLISALGVCVGAIAFRVMNQRSWP